MINMACEMNKSFYIPEKKNLPIDIEHLSAWYSNLLREVDNAGYSSLEVKLFKDQRNYYGKYFSPESRNFFLRHFAQNLAKTINYLFASGENDVKFLEIGCGCGNQLLLAAFLGAETVGCDIRPDACELINKRKAFYEAQGQKQSLNISLICEDAFKVDWERWGKFDAVNFLFSFNNIQPNEKMLELAAGLLKPGGRIVFQETNQSNYYNWLMRRRDEIAPLEVARALKKLNFRIDLLCGGYALPPVFWRFMPRAILAPADQALCRWLFLSPSYQLMAEKVE